MKQLNSAVVAPLAQLIAIVIMCAGISSGADFEIEVLSFPDELIPGVVAEIRAEARNVSGHPITVPGQGHGFQIEVLQKDGSRVSPCSPLAFSDQIIAPPADWKGFELETGWCTEMIHSLCFELPGEYTVRFFIAAHGPYRNRNGEEFHAWEGEVSTHPLTIVVLAPEGIDQEVFEAYDGDLYLSILGGERPGEILRRFPSSTFAAYVVWQATDAKGRAASDPEAVAHALETELSRGSAWVPCDNLELCTPDGLMRLSRMELIKWRAQWKRLVLEHHPEIWFADELRFTLACDAFLMGHTAESISLLESIGERGNPSMARRGRQLLEAMKAKGMLGGGSHAEQGPEIEGAE